MKNILFVEDDLLIIRIYRSKLQVEGYEVEVAMDGETALQAVKQNPPDLVILDLQLPKCNGVEVLKFIRKQPGLAHLPVLVFSNAFLTRMVEDARLAGATKILTKADCTPKQFMDAVRESIAVPAPATTSNNPPLSPPHLLPQAAHLAASPAIPPTSISDLMADERSQLVLRRFFLDSAPHTLTTLRTHLLNLNRSEEDALRLPLLKEMVRLLHPLTGNAGLAGLKRVAQLASALEALVQELHDKPKNIHVSSLRTLVTGVDVLGTLIQNSEEVQDESAPSALALVVDDDAICRRAVCAALEKAGLESLNLEQPQLALQVAEQNRFDIVFLDVEMPEMTGFALAAKLRALPTNQHTPIVFVTTLTDFKSRAQSTLSGGNDIIAKPFLLIELAVKALTYLLKAPPAVKQAQALAKAA